MTSEMLRSGTRRFGIALLCTYAVLVPVVFDPAADASFPVPKALVSHALAYALLAVLVGLFLRFGGAFLVRSRLHVAVLAFLAVNVLATIFAVDPQLALYGAHFRMLGLGTISSWVVVYFAAALLVRTRTEALAVWTAIAGAALIVLAYEAIQVVRLDPFTWSTSSYPRPFSSLGQPTILGAYLVIVSAGLAVLAVLLDGLAVWRRLVMLLVAGALFAGAIGSGTRSIVIGAGAALVFFVLVSWSRGASRRARIAGLGLASAGAVMLGAVLILTPLGGRIAAAIVGSATGDVEVDPSTAARVDLYRIAAGIVMERPLLGYGPDSFVAGVPAHRPEAASAIVRQSLATSPHGWIPFVATGSGVLGLAAFLAVLVVAGVTLTRARQSAVGLAAGTMAVTFLATGLTTVDDIGVDWLFWLSLGLIVSGATLQAEVPLGPTTARRGRRSADRPRGPRFAPPIAAGLGVLAMLISMNAWTASRSSKQAEDLRLLRQTADAVTAGRAAVGTDPNRAAYWHTLGLAYVADQRFADARSVLERASAIAPYDVAYLGDLVQAEIILAANGDQAARARALAAADRAVHIDPNNPRAHLLRAATLQTFGDLEKAQPEIERALQLDPGSANERLYVVAVQILTANGHIAQAIDVAHAGIPDVHGGAVGLRIELARALIANGSLTDALTQLNLVLRINPNVTVAQQLRASVLASLQK